MKTIALALFAALALPASADAEGARLVFDCVSESGADVRFTIAPLALNAAGRGPITVTYAGHDFDGVAASHQGPFQFGAGADHYALLVEGTTDDGRVRLRLHHATETTSTLTPFTCETDL